MQAKTTYKNKNDMINSRPIRDSGTRSAPGLHQATRGSSRAMCRRHVRLSPRVLADRFAGWRDWLVSHGSDSAAHGAIWVRAWLGASGRWVPARFFGVAGEQGALLDAGDLVVVATGSVTRGVRSIWQTGGARAGAHVRAALNTDPVCGARRAPAWATRQHDRRTGGRAGRRTTRPPPGMPRSRARAAARPERYERPSMSNGRPGARRRIRTTP